MATWNSQRSGLWSRASNNADSPWNDGGAQAALAAVPANTDTVNIKNTHDVEFDVDQSGFAAGITLTIDAGGTLHASTTAGAYYLKLKAHLTNNGILRAGTSTSVRYPAGRSFVVDFSAANYSMVCNTTGRVLFYNNDPAIPYVKTTGVLTAGVTTVIPVDTDVTGDIWADGDEIIICDWNQTSDAEIRTIAAGGIAANQITVTAPITNAKVTGAYVALASRNIKVFNSTGYAFNRPTTSEIYCYTKGVSGSYYPVSTVFGGSNWLTGTHSYIATDCVFAGVYVGGNGQFQYCVNSDFTGLFGGATYGLNGCRACSFSGYMFECGSGLLNCINIRVAATGILEKLAYADNNGSGNYHYGTVKNCGRGLYQGNKAVVRGTFQDNTYDFDGVDSGSAYNALFGSATEFNAYNAAGRAANSYFESFDHDQQVNAFKAWCRGGIVTSQTASPPSGYTIWYEHACESATYPCFRQYQTTVLAGGSIEVVGKIRIADGEDLSSNPPALQIIDVFADPLVDSTQTPLDECEIPDPDGSDTDWQDVSVVWANQGDSPRQVLVRMIAYHATADIDECWSVATYQDQIATLYDILMPLKTTVATSDTTTSFTLTAGEATADAYNGMTLMVQDKDDGHWELRSITDWTAGRVITVTEAFSFTPAVGDLAYIMGVAYGVPTDLTPITSKLPTGFIMGSSDQDNHDTDIDAILADTNELQVAWADGGRLDLLVDAIKAKADNLPAVPAAVGSAMTLTGAYDAAKTALAGATVVDGAITVDGVLECLLAFVAGKAKVVDNGTTRTISFYKQDGTTVKYVITASETDGSRSVGGTIDP